MDKKTLFLIFAALLVAILLLAPAGTYVTVSERNGRTLLARQVSAGDEVSISFVHSVEKVRVTDTFVVTRDGKLLLKNTTFGSAGYGLPTDASYHLIVNENGDYLIENINRTLERVDFSTGNIPRHNVTIAGREYPVYSMANDGAHLVLTVEKNRPLIKEIFPF